VTEFSGKIIAVGKRSQLDAREKHMKTLKTIRPLKDGVIADFVSEK
jgi:actin-like ATPase involved in cell morphogenesis